MAGWRLMAVHAHPDDESSKGAATSARYVDEGALVEVVSCTGGERGDVLNPRLQDDPEVKRDLPGLRRVEMARAQDALGVAHEWLGFVDSGLPEGEPPPPLPAGSFALVPVAEAAERLVRLIRRDRPHVVTTYDEQGGYPHPDHIRCHDVSVAAFRAAGDPRAFPGAGEPWQPLKLYYNQTISLARIKALHRALLMRGMASPFAEWIERLGDRAERPVTTRVPCADYFGQRDRALLAHATQIDPDGWWFSVPRDIEREVWPWEDFELAVSYVPFAGEEDDLFAGLGDPGHADEMARDPATFAAGPAYDDVKER